MTRLNVLADRLTGEVTSAIEELIEARAQIKALRRRQTLLLDRIGTSQAEIRSLRGQVAETRAQVGDLGHKLGLIHAAVGDVEAGLADAPVGPYRSGARSVLAEIRSVLDS